MFEGKLQKTSSVVSSFIFILPVYTSSFPAKKNDVKVVIWRHFQGKDPLL